MDHIAESASLEQVENARFEPDTLYPRCQGNFRHELTSVSVAWGKEICSPRTILYPFYYLPVTLTISSNALIITSNAYIRDKYTVVVSLVDLFILNFSHFGREHFFQKSHTNPG